MNNFIEKKIEDFSQRFPCEHHAANCNGGCKNSEKDFLKLALQEAYSAGAENGKKYGYEAGCSEEADRQNQYREEELAKARTQALQEAIEIGEKLRQGKYIGVFPKDKELDEEYEKDCKIYNQAITDYQKVIKQKMENK